MIEQLFAGLGAAVVVALGLRWYIGAEVERQIERRWLNGLSRHGAALEALKQRRALAEIGTRQAEERAKNG